MCLVTLQQKPHVAETDIVVFKELCNIGGRLYNGTLTKNSDPDLPGWLLPYSESRAWRFEYIPGQLYQTEFSYSKDTDLISFFTEYDSEYFLNLYPGTYDQVAGESTVLQRFQLGMGTLVDRAVLAKVVGDGGFAVQRGFHSVSQKVADNLFCNKYAATIPAGALYYEGAPGMYVSNQIIIAK